MGEEDPLFPSGAVLDAHPVQHPIWVLPSTIMAHPDLGQGPQPGPPHQKGVTAVLGKSCLWGLHWYWLAFTCTGNRVSLVDGSLNSCLEPEDAAYEEALEMHSLH